ncbi:hypothetical protein SAMN04487895_101604 [Paenibacillus sophorae]|uniref:Uncharacterized protein n=1 Tax=Paenibacillus sophorae TaxID=1333845 RepID=A0A1H8GQ40_9BACL|nr:hypothetical protein SAMN04487895_101604 [Paenibacillus sophorae]
MKKINKGDMVFCLIFLVLSSLFSFLFSIGFVDGMISVTVAFFASIILFSFMAMFMQHK